MNTSYREKQQEIERLLAQPCVDIWKLRECALTPGGLVNDEIRKLVWPRLVGVSLDDHEIQRQAEKAAAAATPWTSTTCSSPKASAADPMLSRFRNAAQHGLDSDPKNMDGDEDDDGSSVGSEETSTTLSSRVDVDTIERDVLRCTTHLLPLQLLPHLDDSRVRALLRKQQERLTHLINQVMIDNEGFFYYQGYHDVSSVFFATLGDEVSLRKDWQWQHQGSDESLSYAVLCQASRHFFRDFLHNNFGHLQTTLKLTVFPLLARFDPDLHDLLYESEIPVSFCLSWILTWFCRESGPLTHLVFDACLASHPLFCLYLSVALVTHPYNRTLLLSSDPDFTVLHNLLRSLPKNSFGSRAEDDEAQWIDDDEGSVWDSRTVDEAWLHQQIQEHEPHKGSPNHHFHGTHHEDLPVPFEELISSALEYMRLVPPHQLLDLADRYYRIYGHNSDGTGAASNEMKDLLPDVPEIYFFRSSITSKSNSMGVIDPTSIAVVAAGLAEGSQRTRRRKKLQRQQRALAAAVAVVLLSAFIAHWRRRLGTSATVVVQVEPSLLLVQQLQHTTVIEQSVEVAEVDRQDIADMSLHKSTSVCEGPECQESGGLEDLV